MQESRPVNLNPLTLRFPVTAIVSILHRISGVLIFLFLPIVLYALDTGLLSKGNFQDLLFKLQNTFSMTALLWFMLSTVGFHVLAGVRHLIMDAGFLEEWRVARFTAYLVFVLAAVWVIWLGIIVW